MSKAPPPGYYVPATLFFLDNEDFDVPAIKSHVLRLAQGGVTGILVQGSNGEAQHLSHEERIRAIKLTRETLDENGFQNVVVVAGCGAQSARETKKLCHDAKGAGAAYALVLTPSTWPPQMTVENIIRFHREVADHSPIPTMIYNFPVVTAGIDLDSDTLSILAKHPNIVGTKLSCGNMGKLQRLSSKFSPEEFSVFSGRADYYLYALMSGGAGTMAALVNIAPKMHGELGKLYKEGKYGEAVALQACLGHADWAITKLGGIGGVKAVVSRHFNYGSGNVRNPLRPLSTDALQSNKYHDTLAALITEEKKLS